VNSRAARLVGTDVARRVAAARYTSDVASYWTLPRSEAAALKSRDGTAALVVARVAGSDAKAPDRAAAIADQVTGTRDGVTVRAGGFGVANHQVNDDIRHDLQISELVAIPLTMVALIWVFGSLIAALLPLVVGLSSIVGTMAILRGLAAVTHVSIYALNMTTALGLALAIDYSLFIVSRYREETHAGLAPDDAVRRTMQSAGRTVLFSALTVGLSLAAMLVFPLYFLRSFAYAGIAVVLLATVAALVLLPAMMKLVGHRIDAYDLHAVIRRMRGRPTEAPAAKPVEASFWYRFANRLMGRAIPSAVLITAILVVLGLPFLHVKFGSPDDRVLPTSASSHQVGDDLRNQFGANAASTVRVVAPRFDGGQLTITRYAAELSRVPHVTSVSSAAGSFADGRRVGPGSPGMVVRDSTYLAAQTDTDPESATAKHTLDALRAVPAPWPVEFTGETATNSDSLHSLGASLPYAILWIVLATFIVLFLFTGSVVLPLKALVLNTLSLSATFGAMVWVFQEGHFSGLFRDLTTTGYLTPTMPPLMFCLAFGLSMDYEVFLLSRIREAWLDSAGRPEDNTRAVAVGLGRTGRIITAAAVLMAIVFAAIATSRVSFIQLFGTGLTLAVLMDATIVRGMLVPAFMRLAGRWNWWAPRPLARLHARFGLAESAELTVLPPREPIAG
jgi:RND superfamily putative drug exporter